MSDKSGYIRFVCGPFHNQFISVRPWVPRVLMRAPGRTALAPYVLRQGIAGDSGSTFFEYHDESAEFLKCAQSGFAFTVDDFPEALATYYEGELYLAWAKHQKPGRRSIGVFSDCHTPTAFHAFAADHFPHLHVEYLLAGDFVDSSHINGKQSTWNVIDDPQDAAKSKADLIRALKMIFGDDAIIDDRTEGGT